MRVATATGMVVTALVVLAPSAASAAQRYASPTGSGAVCDVANPCGLTNAVSGATTGDEVIVAPGDYALTATLLVGIPIAVHGVDGQPRPVLTFSGGGQLGVRADGFGSVVRYLEVVQTVAATRALFLSHATGDQLIVRGSSTGLAQVQNSTLQNSIVTTSAGNACLTDTNGGTNTSSYRNVTAVSTDPLGYAIMARAIGGAAGRCAGHRRRRVR
jgi:hypothetical protein